jgi:CubicO group peptidase (beta-lactamase class C family)
MDLKVQRGAFSLTRQYFERKACIVPCLATPPQKPRCPIGEPVQSPLPRTSPEAQGVRSSAVAGFLSALAGDETLDPHSVMVLRNGAVIAEGGFGAYDPKYWHVTNSACKSITGLAVGMLVDDGRLTLDDRVVHLFADDIPRVAQFAHRTLTVRHLLTMTSGIFFSEVGAVTETDWVTGFLESTPLFEPGSRFLYNSMNTYMLSAIVRKVSGQGLMDFLQERLWKPLGITGIHWETCPKGIEKGGWGLYIRQEDLAKVGVLVLQKGVWKDRRLASEYWIEESTKERMSTPESQGDFAYGYQIWVGQKRHSFLFNGLFGQNVYGFPDSGLLIVHNGGNGELFQQSRFYTHVDYYFGDGSFEEGALPENPDALHRLLELQLRLRKDDPGGTPEISWREIEGHAYRTDPAASRTVGLLPFFTQAMQNRYSHGVDALRFESNADGHALIVEEADETFRLPVGFAAARETELSFGGESYRVGVQGLFGRGKDGFMTLDIRVSFLEIANARLLHIVFQGDTAQTTWSELPGTDFLTRGLDILRKRLGSLTLLDSISSRLHGRIARLLEPEVVATRVGPGSVSLPPNSTE